MTTDMTARNQQYRETEARATGHHVKPDLIACALIRYWNCKAVLREQYGLHDRYQNPELISETKRELIAAQRRYRELCAQVWPIDELTGIAEQWTTEVVT